MLSRPTRFATGGSRTVSMGTRMARISGEPIYNCVGRKSAKRVLWSRYWAKQLAAHRARRFEQGLGTLIQGTAGYERRPNYAEHIR
jgi:hypothetical protein